MPDFGDWDEYKAWLQDQSQDLVVAMATRSVMRAAPYLFENHTQTSNPVALAALRAMLTSGVSAVGPTPEVKDAAFSAARSAAAASETTANSTARSAASASNSAAFSAARPAAAAATLSAGRAAAAAASDLATAVGAISLDSETSDDPHSLLARALWPSTPFQTFDATAIRTAADEDQIWRFWADWYDGFLNGHPLDWNLQHQIALISDEDWEAGPERIAKRIEDIKRLIEADEFEAARPQAAALKARPVVMAKIATGLSSQIQAALTAYGQIENAPPEELEPLERFGGLCEGIATQLLADAPEDEIAKLVVAMSDTIRELNRRLLVTRARGLSTSDTKSARALAREVFYQNIGGMAAGAIYSTALWGYVLSGAQDFVGPTISETVESLSGCHDDLMGPDAIYPPELWAIPDYSQA